MNQTIEGVSNFAVAHNNNPHAAYAGRALICCLKVYCGKVFHYTAKIAISFDSPKVLKDKMWLGELKVLLRRVIKWLLRTKKAFCEEKCSRAQNTPGGHLSTKNAKSVDKA